MRWSYEKLEPGLREVCSVVFEIFNYIILKHMKSNGSIAQLVEWRIPVLKVPGSKLENFSFH